MATPKVIKLRSNYLAIPKRPLDFSGNGDATWVLFDKTSIMTSAYEREYPTCECGKKYLPKLGCLWCTRYSLFIKPKDLSYKKDKAKS